MQLCFLLIDNGLAVSFQKMLILFYYVTIMSRYLKYILNVK